MIVSFDLDDTLYVDPNVSSTEKKPKISIQQNLSGAAEARRRKSDE